LGLGTIHRKSRLPITLCGIGGEFSLLIVKILFKLTANTAQRNRQSTLSMYCPKPQKLKESKASSNICERFSSIRSHLPHPQKQGVPNTEAFNHAGWRLAQTPHNVIGNLLFRCIVPSPKNSKSRKHQVIFVGVNFGAWDNTSKE
jgi:hypothetical protein